MEICKLFLTLHTRLTTLSVLVLVPAIVYSQSLFSQCAGPSGGPVNQVTYLPGINKFASGSCIYDQTQRRWTDVALLPSPLSRLSVDRLYYDPIRQTFIGSGRVPLDNPGVNSAISYFVLTRSTDLTSWSIIDTAGYQRGRGIYQIVVSPYNGYYYGTTDSNHVSIVVRSTDGGCNWTRVFYRSGTTSSKLSVDSTGVVYLGTYSYGLVISRDHGNTWEYASVALNSWVNNVAVGYSAVLFSTGNGQAYYSSNHGLNWTEVLTNSASIFSVGLDQYEQMYLCVGSSFRRKRSLVMPWETLNTPYSQPRPSEINAIAFDTNGVAMIGTPLGAYMSTDECASWSFESTGLYRTSFLELGALPDGRMIGGVWNSGVSYYDPHTNTWGQPQAVAANPLSFEIQDSVHWYFLDFGYALYRTSNAGASWQMSNRFLGQRYTVRTLARDVDGSLLLTTEGPLIRSTDRGNSWTIVNNNMISVWAVDSTGYYYGVDDNGIYRSTDRGITWGYVARPRAFWSSLFTVRLYVDHHNRIWDIGEMSPVRTTDQGMHWDFLGTPSSGGTITDVVDIVVGRHDQVAIIKGWSVYVSYDDCETWTGYDMYQEWPQRLFFDVNDNLFIVSNEKGVYRSSGPLLGNSEITFEPVSGSFNILNNFPNPFNSSTNITFSLPKNGEVETTVFNSQGQTVEQLGRQFFTAGTHSITWNSSNLPSGTYFVRLHNQSLSSTHPVIVLK